jgi:hypothetical protein
MIDTVFISSLFDVWVSSCDSVIVDFGSERMLAPEGTYTGGWA